MNRKMKNVQAPSIETELKETKDEALAGLTKLYNLNLDIIEIYKITSSLDYMITRMNTVDRSDLPDIANKQVDRQIQKVKELILKIDKQVGFESVKGLKFEKWYPK